MQPERHAIALRFDHRCAACRELLPVGWHLDHRVALGDGGADEAANMQPLCVPCHALKTARENAARRPRAGGAQRGADGADVRRAIVLTTKCEAKFGVWRARGESFRAERYERIAGRSLAALRRDQAVVQKTRRAGSVGVYGARDLRHDLRCGYVALGAVV